jgi:hypothetical protein
VFLDDHARIWRRDARAKRWSLGLDGPADAGLCVRMLATGVRVCAGLAEDRQVNHPDRVTRLRHSDLENPFITR